MYIHIWNKSAAEQRQPSNATDICIHTCSGNKLLYKISVYEQCNYMLMIEYTAHTNDILQFKNEKVISDVF